MIHTLSSNTKSSPSPIPEPNQSVFAFYTVYKKSIVRSHSMNKEALQGFNKCKQERSFQKHQQSSVP